MSAEKQLHIKIKLGSDTKGAKLVKNEVDGISSSLSTAESQADSFYRRLSNTAVVVGSLVAIKETLGSAASNGFEYNKTIEKLVNSLTTLYAVTSSNITSTGRLLSLEEKQQLARKEALETVKELEKINTKTPHTLSQTVEIYNAMLPSMRKAGVANKDLFEITKKLSIATKSIDFNQILAGVDGLATGTVLANSDLGRFLVPLGLTNDALKNTSDIFGLINEKLKDVQAIEDYDSIVTNLANQYNKLTASMTSSAFDASKELMKSSTETLKDLNSNLPALKETLATTGQIGATVVGTVVALKTWNTAQTIYNTLIATSTIKTNAFGQVIERNTLRTRANTLATKAFSNVLRATPFGITATLIYGVVEALDSYNRTAKKIEELKLGVKVGKFDRTRDLDELSKNDQILKLKKGIEATERSISITKANNNIEESKKEKILEAQNKALTNLKSKLADINKSTKTTKEVLVSASKGLRDNAEIIKTIGDERARFNLQLEENINKARKAGATEKEINAYKARELKAFNEKFEKINDKRLKKEEKDLAASNDAYESYYKKIGDYNQAWLYESARLSEKYKDLNRDQYLKIFNIAKDEYFEKAHDEQVKLNEFNLDIKFDGFNTVSDSFASIGNSYIDMIDRTKEFNDLFKKSNDDIIKYNSAQVGSYADITGALKGFTKEGSREYKTLEKIQKTLYATEMSMNIARLASQAGFTASYVGFKTTEASAAGAVAIANQGTGDPYTAFARMAAMAGLLASFGILVGGVAGIGGTKTTEDKDYLTSLKENLGTGTVLGSDEGSESIKNSLDVLEDYAKPEFMVLNEMASYLRNIDSKMNGLTSLLIRGEEFAFGKGFTGYSNTKQNLRLGNDLSIAIATGGLGYLASKFDIPLISDIPKFLGNTLNSIIGGLFGKTSVSRRLHDSGLYFSPQNIVDAIADINGQNFQTVATTVTKKSWFRKSSHTSYRTYYQNLSDETERQFELVLGNLYNTVLASSAALDESRSTIANELEDFVVNIGKISLKGKSSEDIQKQLTNIFGSIGDNLVKEAFPQLQDFQKVGEGLFETLTRVSTGMEVAGFYIDRLGNQYDDLKYTSIKDKTADVATEVLTQSIEKYEQTTYGLSNGVLKIVKSFNGSAAELYETYTTLEEIRLKLKYTNQDAANLGSNFIKGAGSIDSLNDGLKAYFDNFLTLTERNAYQSEKMKKEFNKLGLELPTTNKEFRTLIEGIDTSTESGAELYGRLIILSESFASLSTSLEKAKKSSDDYITSTTKSLNDLVTSNTTVFVKGLNSVGDLAASLNKNAADTIYRLNNGSSSTTDKIKSFNNLRDEFNTYFENGVLKSGLDSSVVNEKYNKILELATSIGTEDASLVNSLISSLDENILDFTKTQDVVKVNIVEGLADLVKDGLITNDQLASMKDLSSAQKDAVLAVANNTSYVSTSENQKSLEEFAKLQLEALRKSNEQETEKLSSKTLKYGDTVGLQERIDLAKLFGVEYSEIESFITSVQALDVAKDKKESVSNLIGYEGNGSTTYDQVKLDQVKTLSNYLGSDISSALTNIEKEITFNKNLKSYQTKVADASIIFEEEKAQSDAALNSFNSVSIRKTSSYYERPENLESGVAFRKGGYITYNENTALNNNRYSAYLREFNEARTAYLNLQKAKNELSVFESNGFATGGFTGFNIGIDQIAGVVHGGEYVAPHYQVQQYPELFRHLDNERTGYKSGGFVDFSMSANNPDFREFVSELKEINRKLGHIQNINTAHANVSRRMKNDVEMKMNNIISKLGA